MISSRKKNFKDKAYFLAFLNCKPAKKKGPKSNLRFWLRHFFTCFLESNNLKYLTHFKNTIKSTLESGAFLTLKRSTQARRFSPYFWSYIPCLDMIWWEIPYWMIWWYNLYFKPPGTLEAFCSNPFKCKNHFSFCAFISFFFNP